MTRVSASLMFAALTAMTSPIMAEEAAPVVAEPTEIGVRFTPGMADALGEFIAQEMIATRYELPEDQQAEAAQRIAATLMDVAHKYDKPEHSRAMEGVFEQIMNRQRGEGRLRMWETGSTFGRDMLPIIPVVREAMTRIGGSVRPMLPAGQQLKMAMDLTLSLKGLEAFEQRMSRWSEGKIKPGESPFAPDRPIRTDENGESRAYRMAKSRAERAADTEIIEELTTYVEDAKALYAFDDAQRASADSVLREYIERVDTLIAAPEFQDAMYANRLWDAMAWVLGETDPDAFFRDAVNAQHASLKSPLTDLADEMKRRIDAIVTTAQRHQAMHKVDDWLLEQGWSSAVDDMISVRKEASP